MKILVDIPETLYTRLSAFLAKGSYSSLSVLAEAALNNQLTLESTDEGEFVITPGTMPIPEMSSRASKKAVDALPMLRWQETNSHPVVEQLPSFEQIDVFGMRQPERILPWGQINKIFPVKVLLRFFLNQVGDSGNVTLDAFKQAAVLMGRQFGMHLKSIDNERETRRDERLSIAFPIGRRIDDHEDQIKAGARFATQYIGYVRKSGLMSGALLEMRFMGIAAEPGHQNIGITQPGLEFAQIPNPILDHEDTSVTLSEDEARCYVAHCKQNLPGEYAMLSTLAAFIHGGKTTRDKLNEALVHAIREWKDWKSDADLESFVNTQRGGLVSRLFELHLLKKERNRNTVQYALTDLGNELLDL